LDDRLYHALVDSGYGAHAPDGRQTYGNSGDDSEAWEHDNPADALRDFGSDYESEWPEVPAAELSEEEDPITEQQASIASHMSILGRKYQTPKPIRYNPKQPLMDLSKSSLTDAYLARKALRLQPSGSGLADCE